MKFLFLFLIIFVFVVNSDGLNGVYKNEKGFCESLTIDLIAGLISEQGFQTLDPTLRNTKKKIRFDLFTRRNPTKRQKLYTGDAMGLGQSNFNPRWPVRIVLHGWLGKTTTCSNAAIKDAYLAKGDFNVILVDWSDYSLNINFFRVVNEGFDIATQLNAFTRFVHQNTGIPFRDMYLIGHSLSCHLVGVAGKLLKPDRYGVIYALDASGPLHDLLGESWRLTSDDALYVESIQTDIFLFGYRYSNLAHASFFPNWGLGQPHCPNATSTEPHKICDHFSSLYYFAESINKPHNFGAIRCKSYKSVSTATCGCARKKCPAQLYMGGEPASPKRGIFILGTRNVPPYGYGSIVHIRRPTKPTAARDNTLSGSI